MKRLFSAAVLLAMTAAGSPRFAQEQPKTGGAKAEQPKTNVPKNEGTKGEGPKLLTAEASLNLRSISDLQFSPDGRRVAFVVTEPAKGERRARHIWIYEKQPGD